MADGELSHENKLCPSFQSSALYTDQLLPPTHWQLCFVCMGGVFLGLPVGSSKDFLFAGVGLCVGSRDLSWRTDWWAVIYFLLLSYAWRHGFKLTFPATEFVTYYNSFFFYKNNFIRTPASNLAKTPKNKTRLTILKLAQYENFLKEP